LYSHANGRTQVEVENKVLGEIVGPQREDVTGEFEKVL
jgi:hypothetical protein